jgi:hypothetical protein
VHPNRAPLRIFGSFLIPGTAMHKRALQILFGFILVSLTAYNVWVSTRQSVLDWGGLTTPPDNLWTIATLIDAYFGFVTFYVWVLWKETRAVPRTLWFLAIMGLGNIAMSAYVLRQLARFRGGDSFGDLLARRNP